MEVADESKETPMKIPLSGVEGGYQPPSSIVAKESKFSGEGLNLHFSRVEKSVMVQQGGGGLLSTDTKDAGEMKKILKNVSGEAKAGEVLAIMGPSGSGKTTLLNVLAGRGAYQAGTVTVNKQTLSKEMKRCVGYVMQTDLFFEHLSVRDTLTYTALLRLPGTWTREQKVQEVEQVIKRLRLGSCADTSIMLISGGEKKRTNIGSELLTNPKILMLDEPTSGLDSTSAVALLKTLHVLALEGRTILTSIHQPSSGVFAAFDRLLLLADGCVIYNGTPEGSMNYFAELGFPCPDGYNAADHCMDLLVVDSATDKNDGSKSTRDKLIEVWDSEAGAVTVEASRSDCSSKTDFVLGGKKYESTYFQQLQVLTHRSLKNKRSALFTRINFIKSVVLALICGCTFYQMEDTEALVQDRAGFAFFAMTYWIFDSMFEAMLAFPGERDIVEKERNSASYHLSAYFLAKTISETPCRLLMPAIYITISYFMSNMRNGFLPFLGFTVAELLGVLVGESVGLLIGATVMDFEKAIMVMTLVSLSLMLTGGYFVENIPGFFSWVTFLSPFKYSYDGCLIIEFSGRRTDCDGSGKVPYCEGNDFGSVSGEDILKFLDVQGTLAFNMSMLVVLFLFVRFLAYVALRLHQNTSGRT